MHHKEEMLHMVSYYSQKIKLYLKKKMFTCKAA